MIQPAPSPQQLSARPAAKPAWMTFCLGLLPQAITGHGLDAQRSPKKSDASCGEVKTDASARKRKSARKIWTAADGFTVSGARRV